MKTQEQEQRPKQQLSKKRKNEISINLKRKDNTQFIMNMEKENKLSDLIEKVKNIKRRKLKAFIRKHHIINPKINFFVNANCKKNVVHGEIIKILKDRILEIRKSHQQKRIKKKKKKILKTNIKTTQNWTYTKMTTTRK